MDWTCFWTAVTALATAWLAFLGSLVLHSWRREMRGRHEHEAARACLLGAFKVRDEIGRARQRYYLEEEIDKALGAKARDALKPETVFERRSRGPAMRARWESVLMAFQDLAREQADAEVLWASEWTDLLVEIEACTARLGGALVRLARDEDLRASPYETPPTLFAMSASIEPWWLGGEVTESVRERLEPIAYAAPAAEGDEFAEEIRSVMGRVEAFLRPKIRLNRPGFFARFSAEVDALRSRLEGDGRPWKEDEPERS